MAVDQNFPSYTSELWLKKKKKTENKVNIIFIYKIPSNVKCPNILDSTEVLPTMCKSLLNCRDAEMWKYVHLRNTVNKRPDSATGLCFPIWGQRMWISNLVTFFFFQWLHPWHMEVTGPETESELQQHCSNSVSFNPLHQAGGSHLYLCSDPGHCNGILNPLHHSRNSLILSS